MTVIVGVKCTDGVVIGADSIATSANGSVPIMQIESNAKIRIFGKNIIVAATGAIGYAQRLHMCIEAAVAGKIFANFKHDRLTQHISEKFILELQKSHAPNHPQFGGLNFGALIGFVVDEEPCLVEFAANNFQPEYKKDKLFFCSMGSGQALADPFLAFVSKVLWKNALPDVKMGRFGVHWVLSHTLNYAPGMVGPPICAASLIKSGKEWVASQIVDNEEGGISSSQASRREFHLLFLSRLTQWMFLHRRSWPGAFSQSRSVS